MGILDNVSISSAFLSCFPNKSSEKKVASSQKSRNIDDDKTKKLVSAGMNNSTSSESANSSSMMRGQEISYILPSDFDELDRIHQQHWILKTTMKGNFQAPVSKLLKKGITVLDSGCGPATWTLEMAETYQRSKFIGVDAYPVFPQHIKPPNAHFELCNIAKRMPFEDNTFDYIHQRLVFFGLTNTDWDNVLEELFRITKPGGYVELIEPDLRGFTNMGPLNIVVRDKVADVLESRQMKPRAGYELSGLLERAGFTNIVTKQAQFNMNHTDKCGELFWGDFSDAWNNLRPIMVKTDPRYEDLNVYNQVMEEAGKQAKEHKMMAMWYYCYAQKPVNS